MGFAPNVILGVGLTLILKFPAVPEQPFDAVGVTITLEVIVEAVVFVAVNAGKYCV